MFTDVTVIGVPSSMPFPGAPALIWNSAENPFGVGSAPVAEPSGHVELLPDEARDR